MVCGSCRRNNFEGERGEGGRGEGRRETSMAFDFYWLVGWLAGWHIEQSVNATHGRPLVAFGQYRHGLAMTMRRRADGWSYVYLACLAALASLRYPQVINSPI